MEAAAARLEHQLVLYNVRDTAQRDRYFSDLPMYRKVDGIIILSLTPDELEAQGIREIGLPTVLVDAYSPSLTSLAVKREDGVSRVVKSLLRQGHHRIGWITDLRACLGNDHRARTKIGKIAIMSSLTPPVPTITSAEAPQEGTSAYLPNTLLQFLVQ